MCKKLREDKKIKDNLKHKIYEIQDSLDEDDAEKLLDLKKCLNNLERKEEEWAALETMARYNLEREKPTKFFCKLNKKVNSAAQFDTLIIKEEDTNSWRREKIVNDQKTIE